MQQEGLHKRTTRNESAWNHGTDISSGGARFAEVEEIIYRVSTFLDGSDRADFATVNSLFRVASYPAELTRTARDVREAIKNYRKPWPTLVCWRPCARPREDMMAYFGYLTLFLALFSFLPLLDQSYERAGTVIAVILVVAAAIVIVLVMSFVVSSMRDDPGFAFHPHLVMWNSVLLVVVPLALSRVYFLAAYRNVSAELVLPECGETPENYPFAVRFADAAGWHIASDAQEIELENNEMIRVYEATYSPQNENASICSGKTRNPSNNRTVFLLNHRIEAFQTDHNYPCTLESFFFAKAFGPNRRFSTSKYLEKYWPAHSTQDHGRTNSTAYIPLIMPLENTPEITSTGALRASAICFVLTLSCIILVPFAASIRLLDGSYSAKAKRFRAYLDDAKSVRVECMQEMETVRELF